MGRKSVKRTIVFKGQQLYAGFKDGRRITGNFLYPAKVRNSIQWERGHK